MKKYSHFILFISFLALAIVALVYMNYMRFYLPYVFVVLALVMMCTDKENIEYQGFTQPLKFLNKKFKWLYISGIVLYAIVSIILVATVLWQW